MNVYLVKSEVKSQFLISLTLLKSTHAFLLDIQTVHTYKLGNSEYLGFGNGLIFQDTYGAVMKRKKEEEELAQGLKSANKDDDPKAGVKEEMKDTTEAAAQ